MKYINSGYARSRELTSYFLSRLERPDINKIKIFCIGRNKTGTTSLASFFRKNGYKVGDQGQAELLMEDWAKRDFKRIIEYCNTAEVFQDVPFSLPDTFQALDQAFPKSKFILSLRSTPEEWYQSLVNHHIREMSSTSGPPSEDDLRQYKYRKKYKGFILFMQQVVYGYPEIPLYDSKAYMAHYENHNKQVIEYFKNRSNDLLIINLNDPTAFENICHFINLDPKKAKQIPHLNRGKDK